MVKPFPFWYKKQANPLPKQNQTELKHQIRTKENHGRPHPLFIDQSLRTSKACYKATQLDRNQWIHVFPLKPQLQSKNHLSQLRFTAFWNLEVKIVVPGSLLSPSPLLSNSSSSYMCKIVPDLMNYAYFPFICCFAIWFHYCDAPIASIH